jgi:hypothetical protein
MTKKLVIAIFMSLMQISLSPMAIAGENLIVFVGQRLSVDKFDPPVAPNTILMDEAFKAKYRIVEVVYGSYVGETIDFVAYDHYGRPSFEKHEHTLLFVSEIAGSLYHEKYQYFPVFKTKAGDWVGCGTPYNYEVTDEHRPLKARRMSFGPDAYLTIDSRLSRKEIREKYPRGDFRIQGNRAYCLKGNPVSELFGFKRDTVLKARGLFGGGN